MKRKLIAFDIDGTLVDSEKRILDSTFEVVEKLKKAGHFVTLATGRSLVSAKTIIKQFPFEHYILCNGAYAFINHEQVFSNPIDKNELKKLVKLANKHKIDLLYQTLHQIKQQGPFMHKKNQAMQDAFSAGLGGGNNMISFDFDIDQEEAIYQSVVFCNREEQVVFEDHFSKIRFTRWNEMAMDATPIDGSKAETLAAFAQRENFAQEDVIVFGDGENDIEMLNYAGLGVVMDNASAVVKKHGDYITKSNDDDGIWHAAKAHGLI